MTPALWLALLGGVTVWASHLLLSYLLADLACVGDNAVLWSGRHALTVTAVAGIAVVTSLLRPWRLTSARPVPSSSMPGAEDAAPTAERASRAGDGSVASERQFLSWVVLVLNLVFLFATVLAGSTSLFLVPCP